MARILVAEDDADVRVYALDILTSAGHSVFTADSGEEALAQTLRSNYQLFDLLLTNLCMPKMNGIELLHQLHSTPNYQGLPAILMTKNLTPQDIATAKREGFVTTLNKNWGPPFFNEQELIEKIRKYVK